MFSNRFYRLKLAAALAVIALLGVYAGKRGESINPMLWRCLAQPERWNNQRLWIPRARIVEVRETSYEISAGDPDARIRVDGRAPGKPGDLIGVIGTFRSDGPRLEQDRSRAFPPQYYLRWLVEAVSVVVALAVLFNFTRHFLFRPKLLQVEGTLVADLVVHVASAVAAGRLLRDGRLRAILYLGVCLPDLLYKGLFYLGCASNWVCEPTHSPLGLLPWCYAASLLFEEEWRKRAFGALLGGSYLHILFDLGKNYIGAGVIPWAFPFSMETVELGWYYGEDTVFLMVPALALILLLTRVRVSGRRPASP